MIVNVLAQMVIDLDRYLTDCNFDHVYVGEIRERIVRLRQETNDLLYALDTSSTRKADDDMHQPALSRSQWIDRMMAEETAVEPPFLTQSDLLKRGWSKRLITQLLGEPDWKAQNPHGAGFAPMHCWREERVVAAEDTDEFTGYRSHRVLREKGISMGELGGRQGRN